ncbi:MAG TPA: hypothetical protein VES73_07770 [Lamprocystis sp. (in: g-proteobacteria)]|nr:hypothetical protein [Lamprocystis sp. (in: g-proteobacteria)]
MKTQSYRHLLALTLALGLPLLALTDATRGGDWPAPTRPDRCAWVLGQLSASVAVADGLSGVATAIERAPAAQITGLIGALGQLIVEAELSHAAVSGRFEPVIHATVAGTEFALEVCRDTIVGEVSGVQQPGLRFVIGDFDGDGAADVAVRRNDSAAWAIELGATRRTHRGLQTPAQQRLMTTPEPTVGTPDGTAVGRVT